MINEALDLGLLAGSYSMRRDLSWKFPINGFACSYKRKKGISAEKRRAEEGELYLAFERLKEKLKDEGLFSEEIKKKLPLIAYYWGRLLRDLFS